MFEGVRQVDGFLIITEANIFYQTSSLEIGH